MWQKEDFTDSGLALQFISKLMQQGYHTPNRKQPVLRPGFAGVSWGRCSEGKLLFYTNSRNCFAGYDGATERQHLNSKEAAIRERLDTHYRRMKELGVPNITNNVKLVCPIHSIYWPKNAKYATIDEFGNMIFFKEKRPVYRVGAGWSGDSISGKVTDVVGSENHIWRKRNQK